MKIVSGSFYVALFCAWAIIALVAVVFQYVLS
jgi:hypothetical protein